MKRRSFFAAFAAVIGAVKSALASSRHDIEVKGVAAPAPSSWVGWVRVCGQNHLGPFQEWYLIDADRLMRGETITIRPARTGESVRIDSIKLSPYDAVNQEIAP